MIIPQVQTRCSNYLSQLIDERFRKNYVIEKLFATAMNRLEIYHCKTTLLLPSLKNFANT